MKSPQRYYPVSVIGGGIIGKSTALALSKLLNGKSVCLVDAEPKKTKSLGETFSNRVSFLAPSSVAFFKTILSPDLFHFLFPENITNRESDSRKNIRSAWPVMDMQLLDSDASPSRLIQSYLGKLHSGSLQFRASSRNERLGFIIENASLEAALDSELKQASSIDWLSSTRFSGFHDAKPIHEQWSLPSRQFTVNDKDTVETSLLIGADGASSEIRRSLNLDYFSGDYFQQGIVGTVTVTDNKMPFTAYQRFLSTGPIALLPLSENAFSFVWSVPKSLASLLTTELDDLSFVKAMNLALSADYADLLMFLKNRNEFIDLPESNPPNERFQVPTIESVVEGSRASFPLRFGCVSRSIGPQSLVLGDAAHSIHPLAGQGLNMGIADIAALHNIMQKNILRGSAPGDFQALEAYSAERDARNAGMVMAMDFLVKSFVKKGAHALPPNYLSIDALLRDVQETGAAPSLFDGARRLVMSHLPFPSLLQRIVS